MKTTTKLGALSVALASLVLAGCGSDEPTSPDASHATDQAPEASPPPAPTWTASHDGPQRSSELMPLESALNSSSSTNSTAAPRWLQSSDWTSEDTEAEVYTYFDDADEPRNGSVVLIYPTEEQCESTGGTVDEVFAGIGYYEQVSDLYPEGAPDTMMNKNQLESPTSQDSGSEDQINESSGTLFTSVNADLQDPNWKGRAVIMNASIAQNPDGDYYTNSCSLLITDRNSTDPQFDEPTWSTAVAEARDHAENLDMRSDSAA